MGNNKDVSLRLVWRLRLPLIPAQFTHKSADGFFPCHIERNVPPPPSPPYSHRTTPPTPGSGHRFYSNHVPGAQNSQNILDRFMRPLFSQITHIEFSPQYFLSSDFNKGCLILIVTLLCLWKELAAWLRLSCLKSVLHKQVVHKFPPPLRCFKNKWTSGNFQMTKWIHFRCIRKLHHLNLVLLGGGGKEGVNHNA